MMAKRMWTKMMRMKKVMKMAEDAEVDAEAEAKEAADVSG